MAAAETMADFRLLIDFCLFASVLAVAAPLAAVAIMPGAGRSFIHRVEQGLAPANREGNTY